MDFCVIGKRCKSNGLTDASPHIVPLIDSRSEPVKMLLRQVYSFEYRSQLPTQLSVYTAVFRMVFKT